MSGPPSTMSGLSRFIRRLRRLCSSLKTLCCCNHMVSSSKHSCSTLSYRTLSYRGTLHVGEYSVRNDVEVMLRVAQLISLLSHAVKFVYIHVGQHFIVIFGRDGFEKCLSMEAGVNILY